MDTKLSLQENIRACDGALVLFALDVINLCQVNLYTIRWLKLHVRVLKAVVAAYASGLPSASLKADTRALLKRSMIVDNAMHLNSTVEATHELLREVING